MYPDKAQHIQSHFKMGKHLLVRHVANTGAVEKLQLLPQIGFTETV